ncbi:MAG: molybdopterin-binding protein [Pseudomonadota bacterium]
MSDKIYTSALIIIGDEVLSGRTHDKNTPWIAERLNEIGVRLAEVRIIPDKKDVISNTVNEMRAIHDYVFTTGGIGPTHDDITAESIAHAFGVELKLHDGAYKELLNYYEDESQITESRKKMAYIPEGGELVDNPVSGAPGIKMDNVFIFAGVPKIMQSMFDSVAPHLVGGKQMMSRSVTADIPESVLADDLGVIQAKYENVSIGSYPQYKNGRFSTAVVMRSIDEESLGSAINDVFELAKSKSEKEPLVS